MKKLLFLSTCMIAVVGMSSCKKAAELLFKPFESPLNFDVNINPVAAGTQSNLGTTVVNYDLNAEIKSATDNQFDASFIGQMYINQVAISLTNADATNDLKNFESLSLTVSSGSGTPIILGPFPVPSTATTQFSFDVPNSPNIRPYFNGSNVTFVLSGKVKTATTKTLQAHIGATIKFDK
jgi:hypothetical protein